MEILKPFRFIVISEILGNYGYDQPFHLYFSELCKKHKNWGSKDRKIYKSACYAYFRTGFLFADLPLKERILKSIEFSENKETDTNFSLMYPFEDILSDKIEFDYWANMLLQQKPTYLHIRKGAENHVKAFLNSNDIPFEFCNDLCLKLPSDSKCDPIIEKGYAWIMDFASQAAADNIKIEKGNKVWDACSGAGGKSIFLKNKYGDDFELLCSDLRFHTLQNLKARFLKSGFEIPRIELTDLQKHFQLNEKFDKIILDVPCSGSGTWGRSPENISGYKKEKTDYYAQLQKSIFSNVVHHLKPGASLYYITCSAFREENEENTAFFLSRYALDFVRDSYYKAETPDSDILYMAEFRSVE